MKLKSNSALAKLNRIRVSPQKLNLVAQMIRGMRVDKALAALQFSPKRIAVDVRKTLLSAVANAEHNKNLDIDTLYVDKAYVGKDISMKRFHARARGRGARIVKPFSRLSLIVTERHDNDKTQEQENIDQKVKS